MDAMAYDQMQEVRVILVQTGDEDTMIGFVQEEDFVSPQIPHESIPVHLSGYFHHTDGMNIPSDEIEDTLAVHHSHS